MRFLKVSFFIGLLFFACFGNASLAARPPPKRFPCCIYDLPLPQLPCGEVSFINGMNHKPDRAVHCAEMLSEISQGHKVYVVYNPTGGFLRDLAKCFSELFHYKATQPVKKLHEKWELFFSTHGPNEKLLQFCHSEGSIQVRNALLRFPPSLRKRIIVIAIAPAAYIPDFICCEAFHYASRRDIVPRIDKRGRRWCAEKTILLTPHPKAAFFDHHFLSPTYRPAIEHHLKQYLVDECHLHPDWVWEGTGTYDS